MHEDDQLMLAHRAGDPTAFERLLGRYRRMVFGYLRRMLQDDALAEEVLIETFYKVHRVASEYEPRGQFKTFVFRIAHNLGLNARRDSVRWQNYSELDEQAGPGRSGPETPMPGRLADPEVQLQRRQSVDQLNLALNRLPAVQREVFLLYYREGMETPEISEVVGIPAGSVRAYLSMARKTLREALEQAGVSGA